MSFDQYVHHDAAGCVDSDSWRKLWVVEWTDVRGNKAEHEHRSRAAADQHLGRLGLDPNVTTVSLDGLVQW